LDAETDAAIGEALADLSKGRTTLLVAHRFSTIMQADHIYVLEAGRIVEHGSHAQLMQQKQVYERLFSLQSI
jgi:ABC-type multidrug transport system fused ATPase/permease subunit